jgi:5-(carboxyamino)imidazole ribonucleotide synthase
MKASYKPGIISLLGGGQLGKMFIAEAMRYDLKVRVLDPDPDCPCAAYAHEFVCGSLLDEETVLNFCKPGFPVTIEIEHVNVQALKKLKNDGLMVVPDPDVLEMIQDKGSQKLFYLKNNIPTAGFKIIDEPLSFVPEESAFPFVQKTRMGGYDGKGVQVIKTSSEWPQNAMEGRSIIENTVEIKKELGVLVASDGKGRFEIYEPVEMVFDPEANLVDYLVFPAQLEHNVLESAKGLALLVAQSIKLKGLLAVELFLDTSNQLLVNEIAPRTHNSGHAGIEASLTSQFEQHARIMAGLPLGASQMLFPTAMINLLGPPGYTGEPIYPNLAVVAEIPGVYIHLYGKKQMKPGRKMGHITLLAIGSEDIYVKVNRVKDILS